MIESIERLFVFLVIASFKFIKLRDLAFSIQFDVIFLCYFISNEKNLVRGGGNQYAYMKYGMGY